MSFARFDPAVNATRIVAVQCKTWRCKRCGPRRRKLYAHAIAGAAAEYRMVRILTLTLDPAKLPRGEDPIRYIQGIWAEFRLSVARKFGRGMRFIRVLELRADGSHVHLHCLIDKYLPQKWVSIAWGRLGGGRIVDIRMVAPRRVAGYVAKYMSKALDSAQLYRLRRVTCSRGITLLRRAKAGAEKWFFAPIAPRMLDDFYHAESVHIDSDGKIAALEFVRDAADVARAILKFRFFDARSRIAFGFGG